jgi:large conductance mechanosensitive channel
MSGWLEEFKKFALCGNLVELAIGFTVGAAFTTVAQSLVSDILMPPIGLALGRADFADLFLLLKPGREVPPPYMTVAEAQKAGAVTLNYGLFLNKVLALVMFFLVRFVNRLDAGLDAALGDREKKPEEPSSKKCPYCRSTIDYKASRCPHCTSHLEGTTTAGPGAGG